MPLKLRFWVLLSTVLCLVFVGAAPHISFAEQGYVTAPMLLDNTPVEVPLSPGNIPQSGPVSPMVSEKDPAKIPDDSELTIAPSLPVNMTPSILHNQVEFLVIDDRRADNQYITTLNASGVALPGSPPVALFGTRVQGGRNQHLAAWYPHSKAEDIVEFDMYESRSAFSGLLNNQGNRLDGELSSLGQPANGYVNPLLSSQTWSTLLSMSSGGSYTLSLTEKLKAGGQRLVRTQASKRGQLTLSRPDQLTCRQEQLEGMTGQACVLSEVSLEGGLSSGSDIQFVIQMNAEASRARYRVGRQWHPINSPVSVSEFAEGRAIELFVASSEGGSLLKAIDSNGLSSLLKAGFYSASRHGRGDYYGLTFGGVLPTGEQSLQMSRLEVLLIEDQMNNNQYVTTLSSRG
ncbi:MAG: hypothetical protein ACRC5A_04820, partial [Enterobacteriaceae bacterium]